MKSLMKQMAFLLACVLIAGPAFGQEISKSFKDVKSIKIKTVSGDCIIEKGSDSEVQVKVSYTYSNDEFQAEMEMRGSRLYLDENFISRRGRHSGRSSWHLVVPAEVLIDFSTASGDLEATGLKSEVSASSASGNLTLRDVGGDVRTSTASGNVRITGSTGKLKASTASGEIELSDISGYVKSSTASGSIYAENLKGELSFSTASGNIRARKASGEMSMSCASGNVDATDIVIENRSSFSAASGNVEVGLAKALEHDVKLSSASGDAVLDFGGTPIKGFIEMTAKLRDGRIRAPFDFDKEETIYRGNSEYMVKTAQKGDGPMIEISTASGTAEIRK